MIRKELEYLAARISRIDGDNLYEAVSNIKECMLEIVTRLDEALPLDKSDDV